MKLEIYSADRIIRRAKQPFAPRTTLISIGDPDMPPPRMDYRPDHVLRLEFDDVTEELIKSWLSLPDLTGKELEEALVAHNTYLFTQELAEKTAGFIRRHIPATDCFICQCEFGQSRSAAVAAAIAEYYFQKGQAIFSNPRYGPNPMVYSRLLAALKRR